MLSLLLHVLYKQDRAGVCSRLRGDIFLPTEFSLLVWTAFACYAPLHASRPCLASYNHLNDERSEFACMCYNLTFGFRLLINNLTGNILKECTPIF